MRTVKAQIRLRLHCPLIESLGTVEHIEDIQMFGVNMTFISSSEVKKCIFHECRVNMTFISSSEEKKCIFHECRYFIE